jgi:hypothetical protein
MAGSLMDRQDGELCVKHNNRYPFGMECGICTYEKNNPVLPYVEEVVKAQADLERARAVLRDRETLLNRRLAREIQDHVLLIGPYIVEPKGDEWHVSIPKVIK